jgi:hypothetical protein
VAVRRVCCAVTTMGLGAQGSHPPAEEATAGRVVNEANPLRRVRWEASRPAAGSATELV